MDPNFDETLLPDYSTSELLCHIIASPPLSTSALGVFLLSSNLVAKLLPDRDAPDELAATRLAHDLGIRVPQVKRVLHSEYGVYVIMDRISGMTLEECWSQSGWLATIRMAFQLRRFVRAMRSRTSPTAGSLVTGNCKSLWLDDYYKLPAHSSPESLADFIRFWLQFIPTRKRAQRQEIIPPNFVPYVPTSFVFTHQDLAPRNLLVDGQGDLWLLDWQFSGWYPAYFEYVSMQNFNSEGWSMMARWRWWLFSWISVGSYTREAKALDVIRQKFIRYPLGRKDEVMPRGVHFDAMHLRRRGM